MTERLELYRCEICGNIVQVMHEGIGELVCCNQPMKKLEIHLKHEEMLGEKHIPVFVGDKEIQVGSIPHPMLPEHHIEFIECFSADKKHIEIKFLSPNEEPKMQLIKNENYAGAFEYCNIHGLWLGER